MEQRVKELMEWAETNGKKLPYPPEVIARLEEQGCTVNLDTGAVTLGDKMQEFSATEQAVAILKKLRGE